MFSRTRFLRLGFALLLGAGGAGSATAHRVDLSAGRGLLVGDTFTFAIQVPAADVQRLLPEAAQSLALDPAHFESVRRALVNLAPGAWELTADGTATPPVGVAVELSPDNAVVFRLSYLRLGATKILLRARHLAMGMPGERELVIIGGANDSARIEKMLTANDDSLAFEVSPLGELVTTTGTASVPAPAGSFGSFLGLGVEHIWTGYDHLLFLFSLLLVCRRFRSIVSIVSCFTLAHSVTLAVATLGIVRISPAITEPAIAATVVFVAIENLVRRGAEPPGRWAVTFVFGLIHGFGFATALRDLGVGENGTSIAVPLFAFNLGVEIGQVAIAAAVLPLLWYWRKNPTFVRVGVPILCSIAAAAGLFWLLQRTVFA